MKILDRREFLKNSCLLPLIGVAPSILLSSGNTYPVRLKMKGDLDDDLFVLKANPDRWSFEDCYQMHNPTRMFSLEGKFTKSKRAHGWIDYEKLHYLKENEILLVGLANEREERDNSKVLIIRTHYKSVALSANNDVLIPSMNPDTNDVPDAPTWFDPEGENKFYNYYRAWENALVNIALVFPKEGEYIISLADKDGALVASSVFNINKNAKNIRFRETVAGKIENHTLAEVDGGVYRIRKSESIKTSEDDEYKETNDELIKKICPYSILIEKDDLIIRIPFPYPFPYVNRIFAKSL